MRKHIILLALAGIHVTVASTFEDLDTSGDGKLSNTELKDAGLGRIDRRSDRDGDGYLNREEGELYLRRVNAKKKREEDELIAKSYLEEARNKPIWTSSDGKTLNGKFKGIGRGASVKIAKEDGSVVEIPLKRLCLADKKAAFALGIDCLNLRKETQERPVWKKSLEKKLTQNPDSPFVLFHRIIPNDLYSDSNAQDLADEVTRRYLRYCELAGESPSFLSFDPNPHSYLMIRHFSETNPPAGTKHAKEVANFWHGSEARKSKSEWFYINGCCSLANSGRGSVSTFASICKRGLANCPDSKILQMFEEEINRWEPGVSLRDKFEQTVRNAE